MDKQPQPRLDVEIDTVLCEQSFPKWCKKISELADRLAAAAEACDGKFRGTPRSVEAGEQTWATGGGAGGAKEEDQGEHGRATHVPDTEPGKRVPEA